jgi:hypothetical protein
MFSLSRREIKKNHEKPQEAYPVTQSISERGTPKYKAKNSQL